MERTEPSFIPGWLKGTGGGGSAIHNSSDEGGFTRSKITQQPLQANSSLESPRKSLSSSKTFSSTLRRSHNTNGADRQSSERDHFGLSRTKSGLNRSSSNRNHSKLNLEQNGYNSWIDGEYSHDADRDFYFRKKDWLSGMGPDGRDKDKEVADGSMRQLLSPGLVGKYDLGSKLKRSQSMGLSASSKAADVVSTSPSANGNAAAVNSQKTVFEHNFPSLGTDDKQSSPRSSSISSPRPSVGNPHLIWPGTSRSDLSRSSSPGLTGGYTNPMPSVSASVGGVNDFWSSALADAPASNGNIQCNTLTANAIPSASISQTASFAGPVTSVAPLNMAEALTQNPPRVRTPPQVSLESQRLEELALRQSRQLIPMTPSLPKTMSLTDKTKSKSSRTADGSTTSLKLLSSSQKSITPSKPDNLKPSQGKLLVLKSGKDGGVVMTTTPKCEATVLSQATSQGLSVVSAGSSTVVQRKQPNERRVTTVADVSRAKDSAILSDEKRTALNAQNRTDFFNTLRKKAAGNGVSVNASISESKTDSLMSPEGALTNEVAPVDNNVETKENGARYDDLHSSLKVQCNGEVAISSENGSTKDGFVKESTVVPNEESSHSPAPGDLEEEEAAFMRSLGWEENEEGSELTEEEINAFYQSLQLEERNKLLSKSKSICNSQMEHAVGSIGSMSSGLSSSDSETEQVPTFVLRRAVSNSSTYVRR